jgi:hypothetical protein
LSFELVLDPTNLVLENADLLCHAVVAAILLAQEDRKEKAHENEDAEKTEKNKVTGEFKTENARQGEQSLTEQGAHDAHKRNKQPDERILERQPLTSDKLEYEHEHQQGKNEWQHPYSHGPNTFLCFNMSSMIAAETLIM